MNIWAILHIINFGFLAVLMVIHFHFTKRDYHANRLFTLMLLALAYVSFLMFLFSTKWILDMPHFGKTGTFALYLIYPLAYLYLRNLLGQKKFHWFDFIHLVPLFFYLVDFSEYFIQSSEIKRQQLQLDYLNQNLYIAQSPKFFPKQFHFRFRTLLSCIYIVLSFREWFNAFYKQKEEEIITENKYIMHWTLALCILLIVGIVPASVVDLFNIPIDLATIQNASIYTITLSFALFLFFRPDVIYGIRDLWGMESATTYKPVQVLKEYSEDSEIKSEARKIYLKEETAARLAVALQEHFLKDKAYLINSYSITDLSVSVGFPTHQVSAYLNAHLGMNFNEYINSQRIEYLLKKLTDTPEWRVFTLEALGQKVGFNNRYTFLNAFKKATGETPSVYFKKWTTE